MLGTKMRFIVLLGSISLTLGCARDGFVKYDDPVVVAISVDKESLVEEMKENPRYLSLPEIAAGYVVVIALDTGLALIGSQGGFMMPITTEIELEKIGDNAQYHLTWGENKFVCERKYLVGKWKVSFTSPRLFGESKEVSFRIDGQFQTYSYSLKDGLTSR